MHNMSGQVRMQLIKIQEYIRSILRHLDIRHGKMVHSAHIIMVFVTLLVSFVKYYILLLDKNVQAGHGAEKSH